MSNQNDKSKLPQTQKFHEIELEAFEHLGKAVKVFSNSSKSLFSSEEIPVEIIGVVNG